MHGLLFVYLICWPRMGIDVTDGIELWIVIALVIAGKHRNVMGTLQTAIAN